MAQEPNRHTEGEADFLKAFRFLTNGHDIVENWS